MIKLNLGSGLDIKKDFINVDIINHPKVKKVDLNKKTLPFKTNYADYIYISHLLEYLDNPMDFMLEVYRIAKPNAVIDLIVDHYSFGLSYTELGHKRPGFSYFSFGTRFWNENLYKKLIVINKRLNFTRINFKFLNIIFNPIINLSPMLYERFFAYMLHCSEVHFKLKVKK